MSRLGALVGIGIASQISGEIMQSKSSAHSFWLIVALSLGMTVIQTLTDALVVFRTSAAKTETGRNFSGWLLTLVQTLSGIETILWTLYVSRVLHALPPRRLTRKHPTGQRRRPVDSAALPGPLFGVGGPFPIHNNLIDARSSPARYRPRFLYFLPAWAFLFGFLSVNLSRKRELAASEKASAETLDTRVAILEKKLALAPDPARDIPPKSLIF